MELLISQRNYTNESLMQISWQKKCSVPQIGSATKDSWEWRRFNKAIGPLGAGKKKVKGGGAAGGAVDLEDSEDSEDSDDDVIEVDE